MLLKFIKNNIDCLSDKEIISKINNFFGEN